MSRLLRLALDIRAGRRYRFRRARGNARLDAPGELVRELVEVIRLGEDAAGSRRRRSIGRRSGLPASDREALLPVEREIDAAVPPLRAHDADADRVVDRERRAAAAPSVCGQIGVMTIAGTRRVEDRPARREVVGRRAGRRRHDDAVGAELRDRVAVERDGEGRDARQGLAVEDRVVQDAVLPVVRAAARS